MKGKILSVITGLVLVFGLVLVSCNPDPGSPPSEDKLLEDMLYSIYVKNMVTGQEMDDRTQLGIIYEGIYDAYLADAKKPNPSWTEDDSNAGPFFDGIYNASRNVVDKDLKDDYKSDFRNSSQTELTAWFTDNASILPKVKGDAKILITVLQAAWTAP